MLNVQAARKQSLKSMGLLGACSISVQKKGWLISWRLNAPEMLGMGRGGCGALQAMGC